MSRDDAECASFVQGFDGMLQSAPCKAQGVLTALIGDGFTTADWLAKISDQKENRLFHAMEVSTTMGTPI